MKKYFNKLLILLSIPFFSFQIAPAQSTVTITLDWNGAQAQGCCNVCGNDYWCVNNSSDCGTSSATDYQTFSDPVPAGNTITGISFTYYGTSCDANIVNSYINSTFVGQTTGNGDCTCGNCNAYAGSQSFSCGIPDYNYGSTNNFTVAPDASFCFDRIDVTFTYVSSTTIYSVAPTSISATTNPICSGSSTTLSVNGGSLGSGASWQWYSGSCGGTSAGSGSSITVSPSATTTYYVRAEGTCNTTTCASITINVNTLSTAPTSISATTNPICSGSSTTLSVNGGSLGSGASWQWYSGSCGGTSAGSGSSITVSPSATTTYYVRAEGTCNTTTCASITINVNTLSTAPTSISATTNPICSGSSTTLSVNGGSLGSGASWQWYSGSCGGTSSGSGSSITVSPLATTTYYVRAEGSCNTTDCSSLSVTVIPQANAGTDGAIAICQDALPFDMFTILGGSPDTGGIWANSIGDTVISTFNPSTQSSDMFTYVVTGTSPCSNDTSTVTVTVNPLPTASFSGLNPIYCGTGEDTVLLTGNYSPDGSFTGTDVFDFGNGTAGFFPQDTDTFIINYTYTDTNGCTDVDTQTTIVYPLPSVFFTGLDSAYCQGSNSANLTGNQAPYGSFTGEGITDNMDGSAIFSPDSVGYLYIIYSYTDSNSCSVNDTQYVDVYENPYFANITVSNVTVCSAPYDGQIIVTGGGGNGNYLYSINDSTFSSENIFDSLAVDTYSISIMDDYGCSSDTTISVMENIELSINNIYSNNLLCNNDSTGEIIISSNGGVFFSIDGGNTSQSDSVFSNLTTGIYYIQISDSSNCMVFDTINITEPDILNYNLQIDSISCHNNSDGSIFINVTGGTPNYSYQWNTGDNTSTISSLSSGFYSVTVLDANNCSLTADSIYLENPDSIYIVVNNVTKPLCFGGNNGNISVNGVGGTPPYSYSWNTGDSTETLNNISAGAYFLTLTDIHHCQDTAIFSLTSPENMTIISDYGIDSVSYQGYINLNVTGGISPYSFAWSNTSTEQNQSNLSSGYYFVTVTDFNGCEQTATFSIEIPLIIPTVITPNGDGYNDTWKISNIDSYKNINIEIYDRWGDIIYTYTGTGIGYKDHTVRWDGKFNGKDLPFTSYIYIIEVNNKQETYNGVVTIKR